MLLGSLLSGGAVDFFTKTQGGQVVHDWTSFWLSTVAMTSIILVAVLFTFRTNARIKPKEEPVEALGV